MLFANVDILRPLLITLVIKKVHIRFKPARITEVSDIQKITNAISIVETEKNHVSARVERTKIFDIFA